MPTNRPGHFLPTSTYRIQLRNGVGLDDVRQLSDYLAELGVGAVYLSPILEARPGSEHGYDVVQPQRLDPALGEEPDLARLSEALSEQQIGVILDTVPNHMGADASNPWWWDVMLRGPASEYASYFDIDWELGNGKLLLPLLGAPLEETLERGELSLDADDARGPVLRYYEHAWPISATAAAVAEAQSSPEKLAVLLSAQAYELRAYDAELALNYRRFFNINDLVGVRIEDPSVFEATHQTIFHWIHRGWVHGLRIDHPDGLLDPLEYLQRLREQANRGLQLDWKTPRDPNFYVLVEKILMGDEPLRRNWPVSGTTGYEQLNLINGVFVDPVAGNGLDDFYKEFTDRSLSFEDIAYRSRRLVLDTLLHNELKRVCGWLGEALHNEQGVVPQLDQAVRALVASFPVYRTYLREADTEVSSEDAQLIRAAIAEARQREPEVPAVTFDILEGTMLLAAPTKEPGRKLARHALLRLQQLTGPVAAKGIEDTAMYRFFPLASLGEVGGEPHRIGVELATFHAANAERAEAWPLAMTASTTHDTKRSEDVRARLNVLSEIPDEWARAVARWHELVRPAVTQLDRSNAPDRNDEYLIFQTLVGAWPHEPQPDPDEFATRMHAYFQKAFREAKRHTRWIAQSAEYEQGVTNFLDIVLGAGHDDALLMDIASFCQRLEPAASLNSLSALIVKLAGPGVPDIYQGTELFDLSLVDPDNRREVDFKLRRSLLQELRDRNAPPDWTEGPNGDLLKLWITQKGLHLRRTRPLAFARSRYLPLKAEGVRSDQVVAFARVHQEDAVIAAVGRFFTRFGKTPPLGASWGDVALEVPAELPAGRYQDVLTGQMFELSKGVSTAGDSVSVPELFQTLPFALLVRLT